MSEPNWFTVTTAADRDWEAAQQRWWVSRTTHTRDPRRIEQADAEVRHARARYRERILSWYRRLLLPMRPGDCVPSRVAELLAEEWDEATKHPTRTP